MTWYNFYTSYYAGEITTINIVICTLILANRGLALESTYCTQRLQRYVICHQGRCGILRYAVF
jgi:hypothetical protein